MSITLFTLMCMVIISLIKYHDISKSSTPPTFDLDAWWGPPECSSKNDTRIRPFKVVFDEEMVKDLKRRLRNHRPPTPLLDGVGFEYGFNTDQLDCWLTYWADKYPFRKREKFLNQFPQFKTNIQGLDIHYIKVKPKVPHNVEVVPLLLLHGWPGSVREFYEAIPILTAVSKERNFAIEVIAPSLPGFGFSDTAVRPGLGAEEMAAIMRNLMHRLGHKKFYVQGGDWGAYIGSSMATLFPMEVLGYHTNLAISLTPSALFLTIVGAIYPPLVVKAELADRMYPLVDELSWLLRNTGYLHLQATTPGTIGVAMSDSPAGLLAYILQIISTGTRRNYVTRSDGGLDIHYTREQLIDNLMFYWTKNSITSSFRIYAETLNKRVFFTSNLRNIPTPVPTWAIQAKDEIIYQSPRILKTKYPNLLEATVLDDGGHFLALEQPRIFSNDVLTAIAEFRKWHLVNEITID